MSNNSLFLIIIALAVGLSLGHYWGTQTNNQTVSETNFIQAGNLMFNNPGLETDTWYLNFEEPGAPGQSVRLEFTKDSQCFIDTGLADSCPGENLEAGDRVTIQGFKQGEGVIVNQLLQSNN